MSMSEKRLEGMTITPLLDEHLEKIHPVIGVVGDTGYVGVWIPSRIEDDKGNVAEKDLLYLVTDKGELIHADDRVLKERGWKLAYKPICFENRWCLEDVKRYLAGDSPPTDPKTILEHVLEQWTTYMELPSFEEYFYAALWDIATYFHPLFNSYPYKYIGGIKRVGKTKELQLHYCIAFNAIFSNNMSPSSIYRLIQNARATLLIDETEKLSNPERSQELRSILLAGYKNGEKVYRVERNRRDQLVPEAFEVYSPKALANISGLEDVLEDRCKVTFLKRSIDRRIADREINVKDPKWSAIRDELYRLYLQHWREVKACYDELNELNELVNLLKAYNFTGYECLTAREWELWKPIIALARFFDKHGMSLSKFTSSLGSLSSLNGEGSTGKFTGSLCSLMLSLAIADSKRKHLEDQSESREHVLVEVLLEMASEADNKDRYILVREIRDSMAPRFDGEEQKWLTSRWVGKTLRRLGFTEKDRTSNGYKYLIKRRDVEQLAERLGITRHKPPGETAHTPIHPSPPSQPSAPLTTPFKTPIQPILKPPGTSNSSKPTSPPVVNPRVEAESNPKPSQYMFRRIDPPDLSGLRPEEVRCEWCLGAADLVVYNPENPNLRAFICGKCKEQAFTSPTAPLPDDDAESFPINLNLYRDVDGDYRCPLDRQSFKNLGEFKKHIEVAHDWDRK